MATGDSIRVTEGSGKYLAAGATYTENALTVRDEKAILGEPYLASYSFVTPSISIATANAHLLQIMAGSSNAVYLRRLRVYQSVLVTTAAIATWELWLLSTAGTGGGTVTGAKRFTTDGAYSGAAMTLPTAKGTEATKLWSGTCQLIQTVGTGGAGLNTLLVDEALDDALRAQPIRIPAGTANGIAMKWVSASTGASAIVDMLVTEAPF